MGETIANLFEKNYKTKKSIILAIILGILGLIIMYASITDLFLRIGLCFGIIALVVFYVIDTIIYNKLPRNQFNNAILIRIIAKNKEEFEDIEYKFKSEFEKYIQSDKNKLNIICIPFHLVQEHTYTEKDRIIKLLQKTNCIFLVTLKTRSEDINTDTKYITEFNMAVIHPTYQENIERIFQKEFSILGMPTSRIEYSKENKLDKLEVTAHRISVVCKYIIARAYYLSFEFNNSLRIAENLYNELKILNDKQFEYIKKTVRDLCYEIHISKMLIENSKDNKDITYVERELNEANQYRKDTYIYYEGMSVCAFLKDRDIKKTNDYLGQCKKIQPKGPWRYSEAFIKAYCGKSEGTIISKYRQAFKIPYDYSILVNFIEDILNQEPDKNMLRFALILLYLKLEQIETAKVVLIEYLENENISNLSENTLNELRKIYTNNIIEELSKVRVCNLITKQ